MHNGNNGEDEVEEYGVAARDLCAHFRHTSAGAFRDLRSLQKN